MNTGRYLYYDYQKGPFDGLTEWTWSGKEVFAAIVQKFHLVRLTKLADSDTEVQRIAAKSCLQDQSDWEACIQ